MVSERIRRRIDALLDETDAADARRDWAAFQESADTVLRLDQGEVSLKGFDEPVRAWSVEW